MYSYNLQVLSHSSNSFLTGNKSHFSQQCQAMISTYVEYQVMLPSSSILKTTHPCSVMSILFISNDLFIRSINLGPLSNSERSCLTSLPRREHLYPAQPLIGPDPSPRHLILSRGHSSRSLSSISNRSFVSTKMSVFESADLAKDLFRGATSPVVGHATSLRQTTLGYIRLCLDALILRLHSPTRTAIRTR